MKNAADEQELTGLICEWLASSSPDAVSRRAEDFLRQFSSVAPNEKPPAEVLSPAPAQKGGFLAFYGNQGRREAVSTFLDHVLSRGKGYVINVLSDEEMDWVTQSPGYSQQLQSTMAALAQKGCFFRRIAAPIRDMDQAFDSLNRWFPLYMTGKAASYYYKRMRDNLNRVTILQADCPAAIFAFSVGGVITEETPTFFTTEEKVTGAIKEQFEKYLSLCEPIMKVYGALRDSEAMHKAMINFESFPAECIQRSGELSFITLPWEAANSLKAASPREKQLFLSTFAQRYRYFKETLEEYRFTDIIRLAEVSEITEGKVPIPAAGALGISPQFYTPSGYLAQLKSILYLLEHTQNYNVAFRRAEDRDPTMAYVKEGHCAILAMNASPFNIYEVSERNLVDAFAEYLRRSVPFFKSSQAMKKYAAGVLRSLIAKLEKAMAEKGTKGEKD